MTTRSAFIWRQFAVVSHCTLYVTEQWKINKFTLYYVALAHIRLLNRFFFQSSSSCCWREIFSPSQALSPRINLSYKRHQQFFLWGILGLTHRYVYTRRLNCKIVANWLLPTIALQTSDSISHMHSMCMANDDALFIFRTAIYVNWFSHLS